MPHNKWKAFQVPKKPDSGRGKAFSGSEKTKQQKGKTFSGSDRKPNSKRETCIMTTGNLYQAKKKPNSKRGNMHPNNGKAFQKQQNLMRAVQMICFAPLLLSFLSYGDVQYKPLSSVERHELSSGFALNTKKWQEKNSEKLPVFFLKYSLYFPEAGILLPTDYQKAFLPGLQAGFNIFWDQKRYGICESTPGLRSFAYHLGLTGKIAYFEFLQPSASWGWARPLCYFTNFSKSSQAKVKLNSYFSYGLFLSLKILDRHSIYALDQDYGINDVGLRMECMHHSPKTGSSFRFCQLGLQLAF